MQHKSTIWEVFVPACSWRASTTVLLLEMGGASVLPSKQVVSVFHPRHKRSKSKDWPKFSAVMTAASPPAAIPIGCDSSTPRKKQTSPCQMVECPSIKLNSPL